MMEWDVIEVVPKADLSMQVRFADGKTVHNAFPDRRFKP